MAKAIVVANHQKGAGLHSFQTSNVLAWFEVVGDSINTLPLGTWTNKEPLMIGNAKVLAKGCSYFVIPTETIVRVEHSNHESIIYLDSTEYFTSTIPFEKLSNLLGKHHFFQIHPAHLININHLKTFVKCNAFVTLSNSHAVPVSIGNDQKIEDFLNTQTIF
jgi:DNA-binding LytR/AlgR family response regulator